MVYSIVYTGLTNCWDFIKSAKYKASSVMVKKLLLLDCCCCQEACNIKYISTRTTIGIAANLG